LPMEIELVGLAVLIAGAFGASLLYLFLIRRATKLHRDTLVNHLKALGVGASFSIITGLVLSLIMVFPLMVVIFLAGGTENDSNIWAAVLVAPIAEELTKGAGVRFFRRRFTGLESGLVYGVCVGLGFSAVENVLYGYDQLVSGGLFSALGLLGMRVISASLGHASYTSITGYGMARCEVLRPIENPLSWVRYYLVAVFLHALSNFIVSGQDIFGGGDLFAYGSLLLIIAMDISLFVLVWTKARSLDRAGVHRTPRTWYGMPQPT
jgi:RsiW-degrading membrane proteinase PrsW (M82 family)